MFFLQMQVEWSSKGHSAAYELKFNMKFNTNLLSLYTGGVAIQGGALIRTGQRTGQKSFFCKSEQARIGQATIFWCFLGQATIFWCFLGQARSFGGV